MAEVSRESHSALGFLRAAGSGQYLDPKEPTFVGFLILISLYASVKNVGYLGLR